MINVQIVEHIKSQINSGHSIESIKVGLLASGWTEADITEALIVVNTRSTPTSNKSSPKKFHYLGSVIFFGVMVIIQGYIGYVAQTLGSKVFIIGALAISLILTLIFSLVSFIIRKISEKFGKYVGVVIWIIIIAGLCLAGWSYIKKTSSGYVYTTPGVITMTDKKLSIDQCMATTDEGLKRACGLNLAVETKNRNLCRQFFGETDYAYYCEMLYDEQYGVELPTLAECQSMKVSPKGSSFYRDGCFSYRAQATFDKTLCKNIIDTSTKTGCPASIDYNLYRKNNLCPNLFANNKIGNANDCYDYVYSLKDPALCKKMDGHEPAWATERCYANLK